MKPIDKLAHKYALNINQIRGPTSSKKLDFKNFVKKTISLDDKIHTSRVLIELFLLMKISSNISITRCYDA